MSDSQADNERGSKRPVSLFDPVAGLRAVADIQAEGLRAAGELLERVLKPEPDGSSSRSERQAGDYTTVVDAWMDLVRRAVAGLGQPGRPGSVTVGVGSNGVGPLVRLELGGDEGDDGAGPDRADPEIWLHNGTFSDLGPLTLHCGQLRDSDGVVLEGAEVRFEPGKVPELPARSSRAVTLSLAAKGTLRPGTYRGTIQSAGAPGLWLPLEVVIDQC